ncbi:site-2 protease family protein [Candidatus Shapirobacteria bacterium]|nr:site-2 protease family protein [Candidatus Shapirobacteria bacterium]
MVSLLLFIFSLSLLIIAHELGHFWAARRKGILVEEFGLGYPPRIWGKKIGETIYSLNWLPLGGFVRILGEVEYGQKVPLKLKKRSLAAQSLKDRMLVTLSGVGMNLIVGVLIFCLVYSFLGVPRKSDQVRVMEVASGSPAQEAGLQSQDKVLQIQKDGEIQEVKEMEFLIKFSREKAGREIFLLIEREGEDKFWVKVVPRENPPENEGALGVVISQSEIYKPPLWQRPFWGIKEGFSEAYFWGKTIVLGVGETLISLARGKTPENIAGPVGIYQATSAIRKQSGNWAVIHFFGVLSVNLAIVNLLPFPALDGSRFWFLIWEAVARKKPNPKIEYWLSQVGMIFLILLLALITFSDIRRLRSGI